MTAARRRLDWSDAANAPGPTRSPARRCWRSPPAGSRSGSGALLATRPALRGLGFAETDAAGLALGRLAGGRDVAIGLLTLAARDDPGALRAAALVAAAVDAADALTFALAGRDPRTRTAGLARPRLRRRRGARRPLGLAPARALSRRRTRRAPAARRPSRKPTGGSA